MPKSFLDVFENKTGKGGFMMLARNTSPWDTGAARRAFAAEESILVAREPLN